MEFLDPDLIGEESTGTDVEYSHAAVHLRRAQDVVQAIPGSRVDFFVGSGSVPAARGKAMNLTALFRKVEGGYAAQIAEIPNVFTQGETLAEARANLREVLELMIEVNRESAAERFEGGEVVREEFRAIV